MSNPGSLAPRRRWWCDGYRLVVLVLLAAIVAPSTNLLLFSGFPLDGPLPFLTGLALMPVLFSRSLRNAVFERLGSRTIRYLTLAVLVGMGLKLLLSASAPVVGFEGCYSSPGRTPAGECELSYSNVRCFPRCTRLDDTLDFGPRAKTSGALTLTPYDAGALIAGVAETNWNLSYLNSLRFNVYDAPGDGKSEHLPLRVSWRGFIENADARRLEVQVNGSVSIAIDNATMALRSSGPVPERSIINVPAGRRRVVIDFSHPAGVGDQGTIHTERPFALLKLRYLSDPTGKHLTEAFTPAPASLSWRILALLTDLVIGGAALVIVAATTAFLHPAPLAISSPLILVGLVYAAARATPELGLLPFGVASAVAPLVYVARASFGASGAYLGLAALAFVATATEAPALETVIYRRPGSDWQTYESFARDVVVTRSLRAGEDVFHYQPGFRYLLFALRMVVGDNDVLLATTARLATVWPLALLYFAGTKRAAGAQRPRIFAYGLVGCAILLLTSRWLQAALLIGVSEWPTWGFLPAAASLLFFSHGLVAWVAGAAMLAFSALIRVNQLPGIGLVVVAALMKNRAAGKTVVLSLIVPFVLAAASIPAHNLWFGGRAELLPTERGDPDVFAVVPMELKQILTDPTVATRLLRQVRQMTFVEELPPAPAAAARCAWLIYASWLVSLVVTVRDRRSGPRLWRAILGLAPVGYLAPFLLIKHYNFYPRHLIIGVLASCVSAVVMLLTNRTGSAERTPASAGLSERSARSPVALCSRAEPLKSVRQADATSAETISQYESR